MKTVVINNREGLEIGQLQPKPKTVGSSQAILGGTVTLIPGLNLVPTEEFEALMKNEAWKLKFETKIQRSPAPEQNPEKVGKPVLEVFSAVGEKGNGQVPDKHPLAKLTSGQCKAMIEETLSMAQLEDWLREEVRPDVGLEIRRQMEFLTTGNPVNAAAAGR